MKKIIIFIVLFVISSIANSEVKIKLPKGLSKSSSVGVILESDLKRSIVINENGVWKNEDLIKGRLMEIRSIIFKIPDDELPHLVQVHKGNVIFIHEQGHVYYEITIPVSEFLYKIFPPGSAPNNRH
jgi:biopolymer transport protein ExbD